MPTLRDLISVRRFPPVVQAAQVRDLRAHLDGAPALEFVAAYWAHDARARFALSEALAALNSRETGGAFWVNGVYGSGKSHFLGLLALLCDGAGHEEFAANHPFVAAALPEIGSPFTLHFSLDDFDPARWSLERAFWHEAAREWKRQGYGEFPVEPAEPDRLGTRSEAFQTLEAALAERGRHGMVACIDELSLFLGGREPRGLQSDAAFLQFLGQHARRAPLRVFAALQRTVDDISGLETFTVSQIRDRFRLLALSLAQIPALIQHRLIQPSAPETLDTLCAAEFAKLEAAFPQLDFGPEEWRAYFPFHPATLSLLEGVTGRFFSRTRSAILFAASAVPLDAPAETRIRPPALFDYFEPELETHPDLRPLGAIWRSWDEAAPGIAARPEELEPLRAVMKTLLLFKIAGLAPTARQIGNTLNLDAGLSGEGNYEYARHLLERLRARASYLAIERGDEPEHDRYAVDLGQRLGELLRRHLGEVLCELAPNDTRVEAHALDACREEPLPLRDFLTPGPVTVHWCNAPRRVLVEVWRGGGAEALANRVAAVREPGQGEDAVLVIVPPFGVHALPFEALADRLDPATRPAFWLWRPRPPLLEREAPGRRNRVARLSLRLLREGELLLGDGTLLESGEIGRFEGWVPGLEAIAACGWPRLFPAFASVAPRGRLLSPSNAESLCLEILRRPSAEPYFAPSLERLVRLVAEPLGLATAHAGRWKIGAGLPALKREVLARVGPGAPFGAIEASLAKGAWGLRPEQFAPLIAALLRSGELAALDGRGQELVPGQIGLPFKRSVAALRPGRLLAEETWNRVLALVAWASPGDRSAPARLNSPVSGAPSFAAQGRARELLLAWREQLEGESALTAARAAQLRRQLEHRPDRWPRFEAASAAMAHLLEQLPAGGSAFEFLERAGAIDLPVLIPDLRFWAETGAALEANLGVILRAHALLNHGEVLAPPALQPARDALLLRLSEGEKVLLDVSLPADLEAWGAAYREAYWSWHAAQHAPGRWTSWRRLANSDEWRGLERLSRLQYREFLEASEARAQFDVEIARCCGRDGRLAPGEAVCAGCGLRFGERLPVPAPDGARAVLRRGVEKLRAALAEPPVKAYLENHRSQLLEWDGEGEKLLAVLSATELNFLDAALRPRRRLERDPSVLVKAFENCLTRADFERVFASWIEGTDQAGPEDEVVLVAGVPLRE